jgi:hypothetical protein
VKRIRIRLSLLAALAAGAALVASGAVTSEAAKTRKHDTDARLLAAKVKALHGCKDIYAAYVKGEPFGKAAATVWLQKDTCSTTTTLMRIYGKRGALQAKGDLNPTPSPDGDIAYEGDVTVKGISGTYNDSTGTLTVTGTYNSGTGVLTLKATGTVRY